MIPSRWTLRMFTHCPKASPARMAALAAASPPLTSAVGSASAYPSPLGLGQGLLVGDAVGVHGGQDVIGGPVDDSGHPLDPLSGQGFRQGPDQGNPPADRRLKEEGDALVGRSGEQFRAVQRQQFLVGGDHRLAQVQGGQQQLPGRVDSSHQFHHQVHAGHGDEVVGPVDYES